MSIPTIMPPPGWYPDPESGEERYWDGQLWTGDVAKMPAPPSAEIFGALPEPENKVPRKNLLIGLAGLVVIAMVGVLVAVVMRANSASEVMSSAFTSCASQFGSGDSLTTGDAGQTLVVDGSPQGADIASIECVLGALDTPQYVIAQMNETRALDGTQRGSWTAQGATITASWTFHPDNGLDIVFHAG